MGICHVTDIFDKQHAYLAIRAFVQFLDFNILKNVLCSFIIIPDFWRAFFLEEYMLSCDQLYCFIWGIVFHVFKSFISAGREGESECTYQSKSGF